MVAISKERSAEFDAHHARVTDMADRISEMREKKFPGEVIAKIIAFAPMRLYDGAREQIFPKEN